MPGRFFSERLARTSLLFKRLLNLLTIWSMNLLFRTFRAMAFGITAVAGVCLVPIEGRAENTVGTLRYLGSDPYAALPVARQQRKLLLVEFYAPWSYRSRWMNERVLGDSSLSRLIGDNFVAVQVPTDTEEGAELAGIYQVTDYPAILLFNANGDVLDKVDVTLDREDFGQRIEAVLMAMQGTGTWRLRQVYTAAERSDFEATDAAAAEFLATAVPQEVAGSVIWPMFENSVVNRYGSVAFDYLLSNLELFRREAGHEKVDGVVAQALQAAMLPYVVGSVGYTADVSEDIVGIAERLELPVALSLRSMADVAKLREGSDLGLFVGRLGLLIDLVPETYQLSLALSLEVVAERGTRDERSAAFKIVNRVSKTVDSPPNEAMLESLSERLK